MFHYIRNIFFSFLFLCLPIYSMEKNKGIIAENIKANAKLWKIIKSVIENHNFSEDDLEATKNCILQGANPNLKFKTEGETLLRLALTYRQKDLFNFLIEKGADINASNKYGDTPLHLLATIYDDNEEFGICPKDLVKHKADIHAKTALGSTPLHSAVYSCNSNVIKYLIDLGADINEKDLEITPLEIVIDPIRDYNVEMIKKLCNLKASLTNITTFNDNIFHRIIDNSKTRPLIASDNESIHYIEPLITHARFDDFDKGSKKTVFGALLLFERLKSNNNIFIPNDIKLHILSKLPLSDLYPYKKLCECLLKNKPHILLPALRERVENIKQILASPNYENKTALQYALEKFANNQEDINKLTPLLSGELLQKNYDDFLEHFPAILNSELKEDKENLARQMFDNCAELFLE